MRKDFYMHQQFLLNTDFEEICLKNYAVKTISSSLFNYTEEKNLFDGNVIERGLPLSYVLNEIDLEIQWNKFLTDFNWIDRFVIIVDVYVTKGNKITQLFLQSTLKALVKRFVDSGKEISLFYS
jgi:hypothetical protein